MKITNKLLMIVLFSFIFSGCSTVFTPKSDRDHNYYKYEDIEYLMAKAQAKLDDGKIDEAKEIYQHVLHRESNPAAFYKYAVISYKEGNIEEGKKYFLKCINTDRNYSRAYYNLGVIFSTEEQHKDIEKAAFYFSKYLEIEPSPQDERKIRQWLETNSSTSVDKPGPAKSTASKPASPKTYNTFNKYNSGDDQEIDKNVLKNWLQKEISK